MATTIRRVALSSLLIGSLSAASIGATATASAQPAPAPVEVSLAAPAGNAHPVFTPAAQAFHDTLVDHKGRGTVPGS